MSDTTTPTTATTTEATEAVTHEVSPGAEAHAHKVITQPNTTGSSIFPVDPQRAKADHFIMPTWGLISTLIACFFILKFFIYLKDEKRHGK